MATPQLQGNLARVQGAGGWEYLWSEPKSSVCHAAQQGQGPCLLIPRSGLYPRDCHLEAEAVRSCCGTVTVTRDQAVETVEAEVGRPGLTASLLSYYKSLERHQELPGPWQPRSPP